MYFLCVLIIAHFIWLKDFEFVISVVMSMGQHFLIGKVNSSGWNDPTKMCMEAQYWTENNYDFAYEINSTTLCWQY